MNFCGIFLSQDANTTLDLQIRKEDQHGNKKGRASFAFSPPPSVITFAAVGGKMENEGPMGSYFDKTNDDPYFTTYTYEQGESKLQKEAIRLALKKYNLQSENVSFMFGGDLLNQCVGTTFGIRDYEIPFLGIYGACSTMSEGLLLSALSVDSKAGELVLAVTSSHYCTAERQYRFPLITEVNARPLPSGLLLPQVRWWCPPRTAPLLYEALQWGE